MQLHFPVYNPMKPSNLHVIWRPPTCKLTKRRRLSKCYHERMFRLLIVFGRVSPTRDPWFYVALVQTLFSRSNVDAAMSEFDSAMSRFFMAAMCYS
jgi:hypothetical protein